MIYAQRITFMHKGSLLCTKDHFASVLKYVRTIKRVLNGVKRKKNELTVLN